ncbi:glycosyl hydrolase [Spirosoma linguale]|uniref:Mannan endo-1,4-beta-mannosidase n=1 Tax=Spirosoma linguale (strain ATCC 33905 / DSM 74 / LMG 10896 / Claus 1) TaxID=504472 RepID=D2QUK7_SPILD|nr:Mannan endo-1,4-beta-mannosidase [Spirosoma linguale DSM 74]
MISALLNSFNRAIPRPKGAIPFFLSLWLIFGLFVNAWAAPGPIKVEAELGELTGVEVASTNKGFSGTGYVTGLDDPTDKLVLTVNAPAGLYELAIGYASPFGDKGIDFQVNEERGSGMLKQTSAGFTTAGLGKFLLTEGKNTITIYRGWGYFDIDYLLFTPATVVLPTKPQKTLVDAQATLSTKGLFSYLVDQYGSKVISGQQDDVEYILEKTGKEPAIGSFDLIDYSPSRVQFGATPQRSSEDIIKWAKKGDGRGIISLMWHWNAPTDLINQSPDKLWWRGFYTDATTFDIAAVLADKQGERYQLILRDIDAIALQLKKFQAADVPVLWRPLHEASGGWFWWGAKGAGPLKELWRVLYDRLINYHQLHNLIWVYTATDTFKSDWYPGDQYVDIVGMDIYTDPTANMSGNWSSAQSQLNGKKLVTLSETGNLPSPDKIRGFGTWWSWFAVWTGTDYIKKQPIDQLKAVFTDRDVITRDELPDWRPPLTLAVEEPGAGKGNTPLVVTLLGNPTTSDKADISVRSAGGGHIKIVVTDAKGNQLLTKEIERAADVETYSLPLGKADGIYFIRVSSQTESQTLKVVKP